MRGLFANALRHLRIAQNILTDHPNVFWESHLAAIHTSICVLTAEPDRGQQLGRRCLELTGTAGASRVQELALSNLGILSFMMGNFLEATEYCARAKMTIQPGSERWNGVHDSHARIALLSEDVLECASLLDEIDTSISTARIPNRYAARYAQLTRTELLLCQGNLEASVAHVEIVLQLAWEARDHLLYRLATLVKADIFQRMGKVSDSLAMLSEVLPDIAGQPELYAAYERVLACALGSTSQFEAARSHHDRAKRILTSIHYVPGQIELDRCWIEVTKSTAPTPNADTAIGIDPVAGLATCSALSDVAALIFHGGRPELAAQHVLQILASSGCVDEATALVTGPEGNCEVLDRVVSSDFHGITDKGGPVCRFQIGATEERRVEVTFTPKSDIVSAAAVNTVSLLLAILHDREKARLEREERATLWPIDELPTDNPRAVATGHMRELMTFAQRVAQTTVGVLICGESGTGKEILARAIHQYSDRADKPFVPLNCAAVPRDLLESQLFGHRRGAFTGADRDHPGVIQSAKGGTLFLDEIGEMNADLQPKLLRFLESGEVCPLGESTPFSVDVRIVAATNSKLDVLVKEGRFREDLFYRLNIVPLSIKPLRERRDEIPGLIQYFVGRAAAEFKKQRIGIADETAERLLLYAWPGNVRQLQNEIRRMVALVDHGAVLMPDDISPDILRVTPKPTSLAAALGQEFTVTKTEKLQPTLDRIEREMIKAALRTHGGKLEAAASSLGISRKGLYLKRQRFGL
jgi:DNA-binding NtrC family response regulator/tetratricopeptide (TPR) repeat protein